MVNFYIILYKLYSISLKKMILKNKYNLQNFILLFFNNPYFIYIQFLICIHNFL